MKAEKPYPKENSKTFSFLAFDNLIHQNNLFTMVMMRVRMVIINLINNSVFLLI